VFEVALRKKKSLHTQSAHRLNLYLSISTKWALSTDAQVAGSPSSVREHAGVQGGNDVPHMYMPTLTALGLQQKSFLLWKMARACVAE
jgi:hypothetical protein